VQAYHDLPAHQLLMLSNTHPTCILRRFREVKIGSVIIRYQSAKALPASYQPGQKLQD
jgi:hypothetical protein